MSEGSKETGKDKRKLRQDDSGADESQKKAREDNGEEESNVTDEEVDEFYAILRRIHEAVDYFKNGSGDRRSLTERELLGMECENAKEKDDGVKNESKRVGERVEQNTGLDLNADPDTDLEQA